MSFEQDPYDREDEEIRKAFAAKDAEIAGLQDELKIAASKTDVQAYDRMLQELAEKDAEIARLTEALEEVDDHGRALSFVETLQAQKAEIVALHQRYGQNLKEISDSYVEDAAKKDAEIARLKDWQTHALNLMVTMGCENAAAAARKVEERRETR